MLVVAGALLLICGLGFLVKWGHPLPHGFFRQTWCSAKGIQRSRNFRHSALLIRVLAPCRSYFIRQYLGVVESSHICSHVDHPHRAELIVCASLFLALASFVSHSQSIRIVFRRITNSINATNSLPYVQRELHALRDSKVVTRSFWS